MSYLFPARQLPCSFLERDTILAFVFLCLATSFAVADEQPITADNVNLTAEAFLNALASNDPEEKEKAGIYLLAVSDASEGTRWCDHASFKTITLREVVYNYLKKQPVARLHARAAPMIEEALNTSLPCRR